MPITQMSTSPLATQPSSNSPVVIFDARVDDLPTLLTGLKPGIIAHVLSPSEDGIAQITQLLRQHPTHHLTLVAHGFPGGLQLGNTTLELNTLVLYAEALSTWFTDQDAELTLIACRVAAGDAGTEFVERLQQLTQATVTASVQLQGQGQWLPLAQQLWQAQTLTIYSQHLGAARLVADIFPGESEPSTLTFNGQTYTIPSQAHSSSPTSLFVLNDKLYFTADDNGTRSRELWVYDGSTPPEKVTLTGISSNTRLGGFAIANNNKLYFTTVTTTDSTTPGVPEVNEYTLWEYTENSSPVALDFTSSYVSDLTVFQDRLYIQARDEQNSDRVWAYDGSSKPTVVTSSLSRLGHSVEFGDRLYFSGSDATHGTQLWAYDGNSAIRVTTDASFGESSPNNISGLIAFNGKLYFNASSSGGNGQSVWAYDGVNDPTPASNINTALDSYQALYTQGLAIFNEKLYFSTFGGVGYWSLWEYDGSNPAVPLDINIDAGQSHIPEVVEANNKLYISAFSSEVGQELWEYDGTNPPKLLTDIAPGEKSSTPRDLIVFNDKLYFSADDGTNGRELWEYVFNGSSVSSTKGSIALNFDETELCMMPAVWDLPTTTRPTPQTSLDYKFGGLQLGFFFDEGFYLSQYKDVAVAVKDGLMTAYDHFVAFGIKEGRNPVAYYNEDDYLAANADVNVAVTQGVFSSGLEHFLLFGHRENRDPSQLFDADDYLLNNPDVKAAVESGAFSSGFEHMLLFGMVEGRVGFSFFQEDDYLSAYADVKAAVESGAFASGLEHFRIFGMMEGRNPSALFDESAYLDANADVAAAVKSGGFASGVQHFILFGQYESRVLG